MLSNLLLNFNYFLFLLFSRPRFNNANNKFLLTNVKSIPTNTLSLFYFFKLFRLSNFRNVFLFLFNWLLDYLKSFFRRKNCLYRSNFLMISSEYFLYWCQMFLLFIGLSKLKMTPVETRNTCFYLFYRRYCWLNSDWIILFYFLHFLQFLSIYVLYHFLCFTLL
jgi:hypothetical protein